MLFSFPYLACSAILRLLAARVPPSAGRERARLRCWVTQQARNLSFTGILERIHFLIHDRDSKFGGAFDEIFRSEGVAVIKTPIRAPQANAYAERFVRTVRVECLDLLLIVGRRHLESVLRTCTTHYDRDRPHRGLALQPPDAAPTDGPPAVGKIGRRDPLGGLLHEYYRAAAGTGF